METKKEMVEAVMLCFTIVPSQMCDYEQKRFLKAVKKRVEELRKEANTLRTN